jgi:tetratricopeptide (TPR) repeat protein
MKSRGWFILGLWLLLAGSAPAQLKHGDQAVRVVGTDAVNVRSEPTVSTTTFLMKMPRGTLMKRLDKRRGWYQVQLPDGRKAWMSERYGEEIIARDLLEVSKAAVNVRGSSTIAGRKIATAKRGDMLELLQERSDWYRVILPDGKRGWVRNDMVVRRPLTPPVVEKKSEKRVEPPSKKPDSPKMNYYREAKILLAENRVDEAIKAFQEALKERPDDGLIHFDLAKVHKQKGENEEALRHFRRALNSGKREEAKFYIEELLSTKADPTEKVVENVTAIEEEEALESWDVRGLLLPALALGSAVFLTVLGAVFLRRRRNSNPEKPPYRRRKRDAGFESVLKYAVEKRPLLRAIEEAERKRSELDSALQERFDSFQGGGGSLLPAGTSSEALLMKVEDLRAVILNQEERAQIYSDLIVLQNEKLEALDKEVAALKKLIQIDYREGDSKLAPGKQAG